jgi:hypothetical protein
VLPMTASGLEYFVDIMVEISLQEREGEVTRVFQVVKSNSAAFEVGFEMTGNVTFKDFLDHMRRATGDDLPVEAPKPLRVPEMLEEKPSPLSLVPPPMTIQELIDKAERHGFKRSDLLTAAKLYHNQHNIYRLTSDEIADLDHRMTTRIEKTNATQGEAASDAKQDASTNERSAKAQAARTLKRA